ncbi:hypothetical protein Godav_004717 [Gossypium davidsonii]|uniref:UPF0261 domain-containing protein n=1 Tax=Gossypium davidsonii TaxID=34287 RepID=A0A7J8SNR8_GOSDV|nr:hypothetical protein [Gossypium davidsonii]
MPCDGSRFDVVIEKKIPLVLSVRALDMVNFGAKDTIPSHFQQRKIHIHNAQVISPYTGFLNSLNAANEISTIDAACYMTQPPISVDHTHI